MVSYTHSFTLIHTHGHMKILTNKFSLYLLFAHTHTHTHTHTYIHTHTHTHTRRCPQRKVGPHLFVGGNVMRTLSREEDSLSLKNSLSLSASPSPSLSPTPSPTPFPSLSLSPHSWKAIPLSLYLQVKVEGGESLNTSVSAPAPAPAPGQNLRRGEEEEKGDVREEKRGRTEEGRGEGEERDFELFEIFAECGGLSSLTRELSLLCFSSLSPSSLFPSPSLSEMDFLCLKWLGRMSAHIYLASHTIPSTSVTPHITSSSYSFLSFFDRNNIRLLFSMAIADEESRDPILGEAGRDSHLHEESQKIIQGSECMRRWGEEVRRIYGGDKTLAEITLVIMFLDQTLLFCEPIFFQMIYSRKFCLSPFLSLSLPPTHSPILSFSLNLPLFSQSVSIPISIGPPQSTFKGMRRICR